MGVLIIEVWAVAPKVFLPHLSSPDSSLSQMLLDGFMPMPYAVALPLTTSNYVAPQELPWTWSCQEVRHLPGLERDVATWV